MIRLMRGPLLQVCPFLVFCLALVPAVLAHGGDGESHGMSDMSGMGDTGGMAHGNHTADVPKDDSEYPPTYFAHLEHVGVIYAHIALMVLAWVFFLPVAVMFSLASSRYTLVSQTAFLAVNAMGILLGCKYDAQTPNLYPNNAHHKIGWIVTWVVSAQVLIGFVGKIAVLARGKRESGREEQPFISVSIQPESRRSMHARRFSDDSGQGSEPQTDSLHSDNEGYVMPCPYKEYDDDNQDLGAIFLYVSKIALVNKLANFISERVWKCLDMGYKVVDRIIIPFGFVAFTTGIVTYGRFFEGQGIFSGLAHWVKGGVFFWLGIFNLGRWSGSFADLGWAWNVRPRKSHQTWRPSAEFVESFLIFFYGSTNIFLEHLGGWGGEWSAQDLEHMSITVLFIGGGLLGMLIESTSVRDLLNLTTTELEPANACSDEERGQMQTPETYEFSLNPIPCLVIMLLGIMMGSHQQHSMISSMVHKQWGNLLTGASLARGLTYVLIFLRPPKSILPSRPPTELLASFGLIAAGIIFMASAADTIDGMIHYELDAMFMYTVTMGLVGLLMAWQVFVLAIKGWASRKERRTMKSRFT